MERNDDLVFIESIYDIINNVYNHPKEMHVFQTLIAVKGDAYTGKTTCANAIAKSYRCSVVRYDDILDSLSPSATPSSLETEPSSLEAERLKDLAFDVALRLAEHQLGMSRPVVIDSPLAKKSHLDKLLALAGRFQQCDNPECEKMHCPVVVVECRPRTAYLWELSFRGRDKSATDKWFKPKVWKEVLDSCSKIDEFLDHLPGYACRLVVDTTDFVKLTNLGPAVYDLSVCPTGHVLNFREWLPNKPLHNGVRFLQDVQTSTELVDVHNSVLECGDDGRHLLEEVTELKDGACCRSCQMGIESPPAYACKRCNKIVLHKNCAELVEMATIRPWLLPSFLGRDCRETVSNDQIPQEYMHRCPSCQEGKRDFSSECEHCLWESHLRSRLVPTILHHEGHKEHSICFWTSSTANPREYKCAACRKDGAFAGYTCLEGTFKFTLHVMCALLPVSMDHEHGAHRHHVDLLMGEEEGEEDYMCDVCEGNMDPMAWCYYCARRTCDFRSHVLCANLPPKRLD